MESLMERAERIKSEGIFLGGKYERFEIAGRKLFITLLSEGLTPNSKVLDIGCGCLRGGYWLIHFLDIGCYCGIEPNTTMLEAGTRIILEPGLVDQKQPRFDANSNFDFTVFNESFDYYVALSIWTHAAKRQIRTMLDGFVQTAAPGAVFLATYRKANIFQRDYNDSEPIGKSFYSSKSGMGHYHFSWIQAECAKRGLNAAGIKEKAYKYWNQTWVKISKNVQPR